MMKNATTYNNVMTQLVLLAEYEISGKGKGYDSFINSSQFTIDAFWSLSSRNPQPSGLIKSIKLAFRPIASRVWKYYEMLDDFGGQLP